MKPSRQRGYPPRQIFILFFGLAFFWASPAYPGRTVVDCRGIQVQLPDKIERVATVSDGLVEGVMTAFQVQNKLIGLGSSALQKSWSYEFESENGDRYDYTEGKNPVLVLNPWMATLPVFAQGPAFNYEILAGLKADLLILRIGSCNLPGGDDQVNMTLKVLNNLGIPVVVLYGPYFGNRDVLNLLSREIKILGQVFDKSEKADQLVGFLDTQMESIIQRTRHIPEQDRVEIMVLGLSPSARRSGAAGQVFGLDTVESRLIEQVIHAKNAYRSKGYFKLISAEHLLSADPNVIILCTAAGYHPARELYDAPYYKILRHLKAVRNKKVFSLPWTPWNCEKRLEFPIDAMIMAKAAYPELFKDIDLGTWLLEFYQKVYGIDQDAARRIRAAQWMD